MNDFRLPLGDGASAVVDWLTTNLAGFFDVLRSIFLGMFEGLQFVLTQPPFWAIVLVIAVIAWLAKGWKLALGTAIGMLVIVGVNQWDNAMDSLALTVVAAFVALLIAIPLGILAARNDTASRIIRPVLDFMQTMPAFVYLIPAIVLFRVGVVPGIVATIVFALAPGVRLTELGIRGVDREVVEAGHAFGAKPGRILRQIQLPLAMPSIMAGVNQVIMLSLSMVVIAGMVGAGGLGGAVVQSLQRINISLGFEAGLSVVIIAMILDRITGSFGRKRTPRAKQVSPAKQTGGSAAAARGPASTGTPSPAAPATSSTAAHA